MTRRLSAASSPRPADGRARGGKKVILGIDPGSIVTGYGVICQEDGRVTVEACGAIRTGKTDPISVRLLTIFTTINEILDRFKPDCLAIESAFYGNNVSSLIAMGRSSGIVLLAAAGRGIEVFEYAPRDIKKSVVGNGGASKEQVQRMVCAILEMERRPSPLDATDALAVALCHQNKAKRLAMDLG